MLQNELQHALIIIQSIVNLKNQDVGGQMPASASFFATYATKSRVLLV